MPGEPLEDKDACGTAALGWNLQAGCLTTWEQLRLGMVILGHAAYLTEPTECPE